MTLNQSPLYMQALDWLRNGCGVNANFRSCQFEAINAVINNTSTLLVEKPGWGKSTIYFICSKLLSEINRSGYTVVVSHWLVDGYAQIARRFGLTASNLNDYVKPKNGFYDITSQLNQGLVDILFTTPDALSKLMDFSLDLRINLLVLDNVHCASDWGHKFKLDYRTLIESVIKNGICSRILATTSTANDRVIGDINGLFSNNMHIQRGSPQQEELYQDVLTFANDELKLGWLLDNLYNLTRHGSGIIYCNSVFQTIQIARLLQGCGFSALELHHKLDALMQTETKNKFLLNQIQILIVASDFSFSFDKPDIAFVIHFQAPSDILSYYQQIGLAGRMWEDNSQGKKARVILMTTSTHQDDEVYANDTSLPAKEHFEAVLNTLQSKGHMRLTDIESCVNLGRGEINTILNQLKHQNVVDKNGSQYLYTGNYWEYDQNHFNQLNEQRRSEQLAVRNLLTTKECLTAATLKHLDFGLNQSCEHCANCRPEYRFNNLVSDRAMFTVNSFLMTPDAQCYKLKSPSWPSLKDPRKEYKINDALCFSESNTVGLGQAVSEQIKSGTAFSPMIQDFVCDFIQRNLPGYSYVSFIPSQHHMHVENLARYVASKCNLNLLSCFTKSVGPEQNTMNNSSWRLTNVQSKYQINPYFAQDGRLPDRVILLDCIFNSGWTVTYCGYLLRQSGCIEVQPVVLTKQVTSDS